MSLRASMNRSQALALVLLAALVSACYLPNFSSLYDDEIPFPTVLATYTQGSAQLQLTQGAETEPHLLDEVGRGSTLKSLSGAGVNWRDGAGWSLQLMVYDFDSFFAPIASGHPDDGSYSGELTVQRVAGHEFWVARANGPTGNRCIIDVTESSETLIQGSATCRGLRWEDGTALQYFGEPVYIEDQASFDAEITFEARP